MDSTLSRRPRRGWGARLQDASRVVLLDAYEDRPAVDGERSEIPRMLAVLRLARLELTLELEVVRLLEQAGFPSLTRGPAR